MKNFFKKAFSRATAYFTVAAVIFCILVLITNSGAESISLDPVRVLCLLPFSIFFGIANTIASNKNIEAATRWILHAIITVTSAFVFLILPAGFDSGAGNFMGFALIVFIYVICILFYALINKRVRAAVIEDKQLTEKSKRK